MYSDFLTLSALVGAACAGFILAQSPRQRATQLASLLAVGAAWWALCQARWNAAPDAQGALQWMRLSTPGWAFIGGIFPHLVARYFDTYPDGEMARLRARLLGAAALGYAAGAVELPLAFLGRTVYGPIVRLPWGWDFAPGPAQLVCIGVIGVPIGVAITAVLRALRSRVSVSPPGQRAAIVAGMMAPLVLIGLTDVALPVAGVHFPRLGSTAYTVFGLVALGTALRYGLSFFTPRQFSDEILETLHEGVAMVSPRGMIRRANGGLARLTGRGVDALLGAPLESLLDWEAPAQRGAVTDQPGRLATAAGAAIPVSVSAAPLCDERGNAMGTVVVVRDLREIEELRRRMLTQARLAAVGELAAGLAHEINNPLAFVRANLGQLERHWKVLGEAGSLGAGEQEAIAAESRELIQESLIGVDRAAEIVRGVRRFTHEGRPVREPADPNQLVEDALAMLRPRLRGSEIVLEFHPDRVSAVLCTGQELRQVFLNLLVNAVTAVDGRGQVVVSTGQEGDTVTVRISDDGRGIPPEILDRIFDPFFTTQEVGEGAGLGLGIAWHVVRAHGGHIDVDSSPGRGTCFSVHLPVHGSGGRPPERD